MNVEVYHKFYTNNILGCFFTKTENEKQYLYFFVYSFDKYYKFQLYSFKLEVDNTFFINENYVYKVNYFQE